MRRATACESRGGDGLPGCAYQETTESQM
jgi:hypothetical protein